MLLFLDVVIIYVLCLFEFCGVNETKERVAKLVEENNLKFQVLFSCLCN